MTRLLQAVTLLAFPHGGQRDARRNARTAVAEDRVAARVRVEAYAALSPHPVVNSRAATATSTSANSLRRVASD